MLSEYEAMLHRHLTDAEEERDRYREAFDRYGQHLATCDERARGWVNGGRCDCGYEETHAALRDSQHGREETT